MCLCVLSCSVETAQFRAGGGCKNRPADGTLKIENPFFGLVSVFSKLVHVMGRSIKKGFNWMSNTSSISWLSIVSTLGVTVIF